MSDESPTAPVGYDPATDRKLILQTRKQELDAEARRHELEAEIQKLTLEVGWIGRLVGTSKSAPTNIALLLVSPILLAGIVVIFAYPQDRVEFWKLILPVLTLTLGYLFGKNSKD